VGGIQTHTLNLSQELRARGMDVFVLTRPHPGLPRYEEIRGVPTYRLGATWGGPAIRATSYILECCRFLARNPEKWDIAHVHQMLSPMTVGLLARMLLGKKLVINPHASGSIGDVEILRAQRPVSGRARLAGAVKFADAFVSISHEIRDDLKSLGVREERIWEIPNGVDTDHFRPLPRQEREALRRALGLPKGWLVVYTGRLAAEKGLDNLLQAWPRVRAHRSDAQLAIVGSGEQLTSLLAKAESLGVADSIHFAGECTDAAPVLRAADAFVLPSSTEGLPISLLEAMACGLPIVATAVGGSRQLVEDGVSGGLVPSGDSHSLSEKLLIAGDPALAGAWGHQARRHIVAHYSLQTVAETYVELYDHLIGVQTGSSVAFARRPAA
jgi:glycosyltransferase involved in cell wall biosynthesis